MSEPNSTTDQPSAPATIGAVRLEIDIEATPARVWSALTDDLAAWWPVEFYAGGEPERRTITLDATPGGHMKETWEDGGGLVWGTVMAVQPGSTLQVLGVTFPNWGGPNVSFITWSVEEAEGGARVIFEESNVGRVDAGQLGEKKKGWGFLLDSVQAHLTGAPAPVWS